MAWGNLEGKVVFITGASAGIGASCARLFVESGSKVILTARRLAKLENLKMNKSIHVAELDVSNYQQIEHVLANLPDEFKNIDIVVNNAEWKRAGAWGQPNSPKRYWINTVIDTNVKGVLFILRAIVPSMIERKAGHIINISSVAGLQAYRGGSVYCASKHAVQAISNTLRKEVNQFGLKVSSICPGLVSETEFSVVRLGSEDKAKEVYKGYDPLVPDDIADNVLYCASRPAHVQIAELLVFPTAQSSAELVHKNL